MNDKGLIFNTSRKAEKIIVGVVGTILLSLIAMYIQWWSEPGFLLNVVTPLVVAVIASLMINIIIDAKI